MFTPSSHDVRRFFCEALRKHRKGEILTPMDAIAADWIAQHPEYHAELQDVEEAIARDYSVEGGKPNPFLHLSMHLSIVEQVSIDQPRGIKAAPPPPPPRRAGGQTGRARRPPRDHGMPGRDDLGLAAQRRAAGHRSLYRMRAPSRIRLTLPAVQGASERRNAR